jgi:choice-of-anchor A domain-containing protein
VISNRLIRGIAVTVLGAAATVTLTQVFAGPAAALAPVNPVRVDLGGHPANSGFLVFVEGNVALNADESEGTVAAGGKLGFNATYNVAAHAPKDATFTAPGDSGPTFLYVGGGMVWTGSNILRVLNSGFTKIADSSTYTARNRDQNNAQVNYRISKPGASFDSTPRIEGTTNQQSPASIATPVPSSLINIAGAFTQYRQLTSDLAQCAANVVLTDPNGGSNPVPRPYSSGSRGRLTLTPGQTNVLEMSTQDLANLSEITFVNQPSASTPLVVNVTGASYNGNTPNLAGIGGANAPYILWNFPQATSVVVTGGATIEGTIYAPNAALNWRPSQNIEGNVIAAAFTHGPSALGRSVREVHDFPFATTVSCPSSGPPTGTLTLVKHVNNAAGGTAAPGDWTLSADGSTPVTGPGNSGAVTNVTVNAGDYLLSEADGPPNYVRGRWSCTGGAKTGRTVTVAAHADVTCEITNTYLPPPAPKGHLTLVKQVVNTGGGSATADMWTLSADGPTPFSGAGNSTDVTDVRVRTGDYVLSESGGATNYEASDWSCPGATLAGNTVTVDVDDDVTCTITNTYSPPPAPTGTLTLVKNVDNSGGGAARPQQWTLSAAGPTPFSGPGNSDAVNNVVVETGDYQLSESGGPNHYSAGNWTCAGGTQHGNAVTIAAGDDVTCTITNTYTPPPPPTGTLTLVKNVVNTGGGTATADQWTLSADGPTPFSGAGNSSDVTSVQVLTGDYQLSESDGPADYTASAWDCAGGSLSGSTVGIAAGDDATCTITNTYTPPPTPTGTLTLVKDVVNTGGGAATPGDWTLSADGPTPFSGAGNTGEVSNVVVATGDYQLSESDGPADYTASSWSCPGAPPAGATVTVATGDDVTCTITNTYSPPVAPSGTLTLVKNVDNSGGGAARPQQWKLSADGPTPIHGVANTRAVRNVVVETGDYQLSESGGPDHYTEGDWTCVGGAQQGSTVTIAAGDDVTCTITNTYSPPPPPPPTGRLTLVKHVDNGDDGLARPDEWTLNADGPTPVSGPGNSVTDVKVLTGDYELSESGGPDSYTAGDWSCTGGTLAAATVTVAEDADVRCEITNTYVPPPAPTAHLSLVKHVDNTGGGLATPDQWTLTADGPIAITGPGNSSEVTNALVSPGDYDLSESGAPADYTASDWTCTDATLHGATVTIEQDHDATCEITNTYTPPIPPPAGTVTLAKRVDNHGGGTAAPSDWMLTADGPQTVSGNANSVNVTAVVVAIGSYQLSESGGPSGYTASDWHCTGGSLTGNTLDLAHNANAVCTVTNTFVPAAATSTPPSGSPSGSPSATVVSRSSGNPPPGGLAATGTHIAPLIVAGLILIGLGTGLLAVLPGRRRRAH